jgi:hypothetical protein
MIMGLIFIEKTYFIGLVQDLSLFHGEERKGYLQECFSNLMRGISEHYNTSTIESFKKELEVFAEAVLATK